MGVARAWHWVGLAGKVCSFTETSQALETEIKRPFWNSHRCVIVHCVHFPFTSLTTTITSYPTPSHHYFLPYPFPPSLLTLPLPTITSYPTPSHHHFLPYPFPPSLLTLPLPTITSYPTPSHHHFLPYPFPPSPIILPPQHSTPPVTLQ